MPSWTVTNMTKLMVKDNSGRVEGVQRFDGHTAVFVNVDAYLSVKRLSARTRS